MMASGRFADYLGMGVIGDRPAAPVLLSYMVGLWYSTDTLEWSAWNGSAWLEDIMAGGGGAGVVETIVAGTGITVDSTDPANPIVAATGGGTGTVDSIIGGTGIDVDATDPANPVANLDSASIASLALADSAMQPGDGVSIITEASTSTMDPATHAGLNRYIRAADDVTFNTAESYTAGEVYNIRATAAMTLIGTGVTLTAPAGGTLALDAAMSVTVVMTTSSAGDVIGQTVPV